ncbi:MAG: SDR family NAD(P)-dependent oxidoreductase [Saprospiraceae bacterium]
MQHILVTGVSSGIGYTAAQYFIEKGYHVFGSVRKVADGERLTAEWGDSISPLLFDVVDEAAIAKAVEQVKQRLAPGENLFGLVANAGIHIPGPILNLSRDDMRHQFEVNVFGSLNVIQAFVPLLRATTEQKAGRIIHVGSTSGAIPLPFSALYAATKSAMHSLCDTLRRELMLYEIDVIDIYVGPVKNEMVAKVAVYKERYKETDYYHSISMRLENALVNTIPKGLTEQEVAVVLLKALETSKPKHRFAVNKDWFNTWFLPNLLPIRLLDKILAKKLQLRPEDFAKHKETI